MSIILLLTIVLSVAQYSRVHAAIIWYKDGVNPWSDNIIPFTFGYMNAEQRQLVNYVMKDLEKRLCVTFQDIRIKAPKYGYVLIRKDRRSCSAYHGEQKVGKEMKLRPDCFTLGTIRHEFGHVLGLSHELKRSDRARFIDFHEKNFAGDMNQFSTIHPLYTKILGDFDFQSLMLYNNFAGSRNGKPVWTSKTSNLEIVSPFVRDFSFYDMKMLHDFYKCSDRCPNTKCPDSTYMSKDCECITKAKYADLQCIDEPISSGLDCKQHVATNGCYDTSRRHLTSQCRKSCGVCYRYGTHGNEKMPEKFCPDTKPAEKCREMITKKSDCLTNGEVRYNCQKTCKLYCNTQVLRSTALDACINILNDYKCEWRVPDPKKCDAQYKSLCPKQCGSCTLDNDKTKPKCQNYDSDEKCDKYAIDGRCNYYYKNCRGSCTMCGFSYPREKPVSGDVRKSCVDMSDKCDEWAKSNDNCRRRKDFMKIHCKKTCNFCNEPKFECKDTRRACQRWKNAGICDNYRKLYLGWSYCPKSCNLC